MTGRTNVSVYAVHDGGATGELLGGGSLVDPFFVVVHPPLGPDLAERPGGLRVGISAVGTDVVEVIDASAVHVFGDDAGGDLVGLELGRDSALPTEPMPTEDGADPVVAVRDLVLNAPPLAPAALVAGGPVLTGFVFCRIFPHAKRCQ